MKRVMVPAALILLSILGSAGLARSSDTAPTEQGSRLTVFDLFELSPEQFATLMSKSDD